MTGFLGSIPIFRREGTTILKQLPLHLVVIVGGTTWPTAAAMPDQLSCIAVSPAAAVRRATKPLQHARAISIRLQPPSAPHSRAAERPIVEIPLAPALARRAPPPRKRCTLTPTQAVSA